MNRCLFFRKLSFSIFLITGIFISGSIYAQPGNNTCGTAVSLTPSLTCNSIAGDLQNATNDAPTGACGGATSTTTFGVWYTFTAASPNATITVGGLGSNLGATTTWLELLSGTCGGTLTSIVCQNVSSSMSLTTLTPGATYYVRLYVTSAPTSNPGNRRGFSICLVSSPNDACSTDISLTSNTTCSNTAGSLLLSTPSGSIPAGCQPVGTHYDVWYSFVALNTTSTVTISSLGSNFSNPAIQLFSGACGALTSLACGTTTLTSTTLTIGNTYLVRVSNVGSVPASNGGFNICVTHPPPPPTNNNCSTATSITATTSCSNTIGTLNYATASTGNPVGCEGPGTHYDVWYTFIAGQTYELINLSGLGSNFTNPAVQVYSGTCGSLTSIACGTTFPMGITGLTIGTTYSIRVSNVGTAITTNGGFSICVYHPTAANYDYSKSYVNITKNSGGGTISPGDTLEIRATLAVRSSFLDSLSFTDTLYNTRGLRLIPGSIILRTNEGKIYKSFTDAIDADAGRRYTNGLDTIISMNIGVGATNSARGRLANTSKPSVFGGTCIIMATYRVVVYAGYGGILNVGGGAFSIKDGSTTILANYNLSKRNALVYSSPGLCPNAVSATNAIGGDFNGTFGTPTGGTPLARNRGTSPNVPSYIYKTFATGQGPNDYYYGIANNTSATYTTVNTWPKNDTRRVFNVWDITGDHTGASNTAKGNSPCDTTLAVSPTNPCGYMLVINSAYKTDTAFTFPVTNLCPNTYYEISAWIKNICSKCSCDSNGVGASGAGYIPFAPNDSSGVQPNLAFDIDGTDYFTTGNIVHTGSVANQQRGSDSTNIWVKRGFTYLTGPSQTSFTLSIRNNAPGGGGNDWALDDIALATCLPNMNYSPSLNPPVCDSNVLTIHDTIRSYFNNYTYYKWQRSTNNGSSWADVTAALGPASPVWNGTAWEYVTSYTIPPSNTNLSDSGDLYRVIVATTSANLANSNCQFTDGISIITLRVIDCSFPLKSDLLTANGKLVNNQAKISWTTSRESEFMIYDIEKSIDGINFIKIGSLPGLFDNNAEINYYSFLEQQEFAGKAYYRIIMKNNSGSKKYSQTIQLSKDEISFSFGNVVNPFSNELLFNIKTKENVNIEVSLIDLFGKKAITKNFIAYTGINVFSLSNTDNLSKGIYILQVRCKEEVLNYKVLKN